MLIVDDEADVRELVSFVLETYGMNVCCAASAAEVLAMLETYRPDVIVSDIAMADEDGYYLVRRIRSRKETEDIPVIALTAFGRKEDRQRALGAGFNVHLVKPVEPTALVATVTDLAHGPKGLEPDA